MHQRIRYFLRAAETGSFSTAARDLFISAQALTKQIDLLEKELGGELFERSRQGVELTPFGEYARQKLSEITEQFDQIMEDLKAYSRDAKEQISIGIFSALPKDEIVTPVVSFFLANYPEYQISLEMLELEEGRQKLIEGRLDLLITQIHEQENWTGYKKWAFNETDTKVVVSLAHPWVLKDHITEEDLKQEVFLKIPVNDNRYQVKKIDNFYRHVPCRSEEENPNFNTMLMMLGQAKGFALMPDNFEGWEKLRLKAFPYPGKTLKCYAALIYKKDHRKDFDMIVKELVEEFELKCI